MRTKMSRVERAKQFMPFSPLKGLEEALAERARIPVPRAELAPDAAELLDRRLKTLQAGESVTAVFYTPNGQKTVTDRVMAVDLRARTLVLGDLSIAFDDLYALD